MTSSCAYNRHADDPELRRRAANTARRFIRDETQFQLGYLPTEQAHPLTLDFSQRVQARAQDGVSQLLEVDLEIAGPARRAVLTPEFDRLVKTIRGIASAEPDESGRLPRICFSGCGSTGRLSMMLEEMWRYAWQKAEWPVDPAEGIGVTPTQRSDQACSIMTGGDRALIRAVENFEDYRAFGAQQVADLQLQAGDLLVAISEGGETSSVIGTAEEARRRGLHVFFVFNNPATLLIEHIERSRRIITDPGVTSIDLFTGPMALSGSTRMQATTAEMLVVGLAQEEALTGALASDPSVPAERESGRHTRLAAVDAFSSLLQSLLRDPNRETLARLAADEAALYRAGGRITYFAADFLLDIFSDTTERSPTFMLPPFRPTDDAEAPVSWAFAKNPHVPTPQAWARMLRREPRGIAWTATDYRRLGAAPELQDDPPQLDLAEIHRYAIGREVDESRWSVPSSTALRIDVDDGADASGRAAHGEAAGAVKWAAGGFASRKLLTIDMRGDRRPESESRGTAGSDRDASPEPDYHLQPEVASSTTRLFHHLAVKLIFNTMSTASMGILGRIRGNWMIQVDPTNKKLIDRGSRIIAQLAGISYEEACTELHISLEARRAAAETGESSTTSPVVAALERLGELDGT